MPMKTGAVAVAWLMLVGACDDVTPQRIEQWKNTEKGPHKLAAAVAQGGLAPGLRAQAAVALIDIGQPDTVNAAMAAMAGPDRQQVIASVVPLFTSIMETAPPGRAIDARDALFDLRELADPAGQRAIDAALLPSCLRDLRAGRYAGGRHTIDRILSAMGPAAGPPLVQLLEEPGAPYPAIVEVLVKVGDPMLRERAGRALVARAGKQPMIPPPLWRAIAVVGGKPAIEFLESKIEKAPAAEATTAARALQQGPRDPSLVPFALRIAGDSGANENVREEMFGVLEHVGGPEVRDGAVRLIAGDPREKARYRAYELAVAVGKTDALGPALEAFPAKAAYKREDVQDFLVKDIEKLGAPARPAVTKLLSSPSPLARITAVMALEKLGTAGDAGALGALAGDKAAPKGFPAGTTVGSEAGRVAAALLQKTGGKP
jgi:HEAT repeat protein